MIESTFVRDRNVPLNGSPKGGRIEADGDEQQGVGTGGSAGADSEQATTDRSCEPIAGGELRTGEAEVDTACESSLARSDPESAAETGVKSDNSGGAGTSLAWLTANRNKKTEKQERGHSYRALTNSHKYS